MQPTHYHRAVCDYLEQQEPGLWGWAARAGADDDAGTRLQLLKTCYQLSPDAYPELHASAIDLAARLGIDGAVACYQANHAEGLNAAVLMADDEAHIIFYGPVMALMDAAELRAVLAHELAHVLLWQTEEGRYLRAMRILDRLAAEEREAGVWTLTAARYRQYTELYADRGAFLACGDIAPCIASLVKIQTGLQQVHVPSYIDQAGKILAQAQDESHPGSHPQAYVRTRALVLQAAGAATDDPAIAQLLAGPLDSDKLDIVGQLAVHATTRSMLARLLEPAWLRSDAVMALARRYFSDFADADAEVAHADRLQLPPAHRLGTYLSLVLLDFSCVDPALDDLPAAAALGVADELGIAEEFERLLLKETKLKKAALAKLRAAREALLARAAAAATVPAPATAGASA